jgi:hypothetical protein
MEINVKTWENKINEIGGRMNDGITYGCKKHSN